MELNVTYIIFDGYLDIEKYRALYFVIFCSAFIIVIFSNSTIICLIWIHKNLHEPMYFFIAALLFNSILLSTTFYPKIMVDILSEKQVVTYSTCLFQWYILYSIAGAEFWLLMVMAYDRYLAICKPLQYPTVMTKFKVNLLLAVAWSVPALQLAAILIASQINLCSFIHRGIFCNSMLLKMYCADSNALKEWGLFGMINLIFIPVIFNCFTYIQIFIIADRRGMKIRNKALRTCVPHLVVLCNCFCLSMFDVLLARFEGEFPKIGRFIINLQIILFHPLCNPFIYGLKMKKISAHLKRMLCGTNSSNALTKLSTCDVKNKCGK